MRLFILLISICAVLAPTIHSSRALAHDWYPYECCSDRDCGTTTARWSSTHGWIVLIDDRFPGVSEGTTPFEVVVPKEAIKQLAAPDNNAHVCWDGHEVLCFWKPHAGL